MLQCTANLIPFLGLSVVNIIYFPCLLSGKTTIQLNIYKKERKTVLTKIINNNLIGSRADQIMVYRVSHLKLCQSKINWNFCMKKEPEG